MLGSLNTHVHNPGIPSPYKSGAPKPPFLGRLRNSTATLTACIFGKKHDIYNRPSALTTTRERLCIIPKCHELWYTNGFKLDCHFYWRYINTVFYVIARLRRRRSAIGQRRWKMRKVSYTVQKFRELWSTDGLKCDRTFFTHPHYFVVSQSIAHRLIVINVALHSDLKWNGVWFVCSSDSKPNKMLSCNCDRVGRP